MVPLYQPKMPQRDALLSLTRPSWRFHAALGLCSWPSRFPWLQCLPPREQLQLLCDLLVLIADCQPLKTHPCW